jgi:cyanophycinase
MAALIMVGCAGSNRERAGGRLIIAGGGTSAENEEVYSKFMEKLPPDGVIGVLPTASGVAVESAASAVKTLTRYAGGRHVNIIDITSQTSQRASDPEFVDEIKACRALWFTGGDQSRIVAAFRPAAGDTPGYHAARAVLDGGGVIGGTSAGAAMMSDPMITGGRSDDALLGKSKAAGDDSGFGTAKGMGFFPYGLTDQHFLRRGRLGRLVAALELTGLKRGFGIEENCALCVDIADHTATVLGPVPAMVLVDISNVQRDGPARRGVRVSLLNDGDRVDGLSGIVQPEAKRKSAAPGASPQPGELPEAWAAGAITVAFRKLAANPKGPVELHSPAFSVTLSADDRTGFYSDPAAPDRITVLNARLDIVPAPAKP